MPFEARIWQALNILAILVSAFGVLYSGLLVPNSLTEKQLKSTPPITVEFANGLLGLEKGINLSVLIDNKTMKNLAVSSTTITNTGSVPITQSDIDVPLTLHVDKPWRILAVINGTGTQNPIWTTEHPNWRRIDDQQFEASKELLNPSESIKAFIFLTNTEQDNVTNDQLAKVKPAWSGHILNLRAITEETNPRERLNNDPFRWLPVIILYGSSVLVTLLSTIIFMAVYLYLLYEQGYLKSGTWQAVGIIIGISFISLAASESATIFFLPDAYRLFSNSGLAENLSNMPWILANLVLLMWLSWRTWKSRKARSSATTTSARP